jgi:ribosomal protein S18 acetylase RimI-like enzyme
MARVESIAENTRMARTMLTVLKTNAAAARFYERLGYVEDRDTPRDEACHYVILTKPAEAGRGGEGVPPRRSSGVVNP